MDKMGRKILIIGDVFLSEKDILLFFKKVRDDLKDYLILANLEGSIDFGKNTHTKKAVRLALPALKKEAIPANLIFSMVNNHVTDFGIANFQKNISYFGDKAIISTKKNIFHYIGGNKITFLADKKEQCIIKDTEFISFSNRQVDLIGGAFSESVVIVHGGIEHRKYPTHYQRALARKIVEFGARMVVFHHSHIIGHYEYWNGRLIHYGLGNAFFSNTLDLHLLNKSVSHGILCDNESRILKLHELNILDKNVSYNEQKVDQLSSSEYVHFYKNQYKLDGSFRPRQLSTNDFWINIQFFIWDKIAGFLVRWQLSKKVKAVLNLLIGKKL